MSSRRVWILPPLLGLLLVAATALLVVNDVTFVNGPTAGYLHGAPAPYYAAYDPEHVSMIEIRDSWIPWGGPRLGGFFVTPFLFDWVIFSLLGVVVVVVARALSGMLPGLERLA